MTETLAELQAEAESSACRNVPRNTLTPGILGRALKALQKAQPYVRLAAARSPSERRTLEAEGLLEEIAAILDGKPASAEGR